MPPYRRQRRILSGFLLRLQTQLLNASFVSGASIIERLRYIKSDSEIAALEAAARQIDAVWTAFCEDAGALIGQTELKLRARIDQLMRQYGFEDVSWVDVGAGANGASPLHHGSEHVIARGEPVVFDFAGCFEGYYGDICRVAVSGKPSPDYSAHLSNRARSPGGSV